MKILIHILLLSGLVFAQQQVDIPWPTLADSPWPMIKHDPQLTGRSPYKGPQKLNILWIKDMPNGIFSGPIIGENNNIFFGSYYVFGDEFYSYTPDGEEVWVYQTGNGRATQSGIIIDSSGTIYFGSRDSCLYALNPDGSLKWKYNTSGSIIQQIIPNIDLQGNIYVTNFKSALTDEGELYSINPDGTLNWHVTYETGFASKSPTLSVDGNTIYIPARDSNLYALNLDGSVKWKFSCGNIPAAVMVDAQDNIYFIPTEIPQYLYALRSDMSIKWKYFIQAVGPLDLIPIPTIDKNGNIYAIAIDTTAPYWRTLVSLDNDGNFRWKYVLDDYESLDFFQPLICDAGGTVYFGDGSGHYFYAINSNGELLWIMPLIEQWQQVDNTGAIAEDGTLYLGVHDVSVFPGHQRTLIAIKDTSTSDLNESPKLLEYNLTQNFPNPFNPVTTIIYEMPERSYVTIKVYDVLGNDIATLVDEEKPAGSYEIEFNGRELSSGIYFYILTSGNFTSTKKLILLK